MGARPPAELKRIGIWFQTVAVPRSWRRGGEGDAPSPLHLPRPRLLRVAREAETTSQEHEGPTAPGPELS